MFKIRVWVKDEDGVGAIELSYLHPRRYMCGYTFEEIYKYAKKELEWYDVEKENVSSFEIYCPSEHWSQSIEKVSA